MPNITAHVSFDITLKILSDSTIKRSLVKQEDLKPTLLTSLLSLLISLTSLSKYFTNTKKTYWVVLFSYRPLPDIYHLIFSRVYSRFFRTTTKIQPRADPHEKSRVVMPFLTNLGATETFPSFW